VFQGSSQSRMVNQVGEFRGHSGATCWYVGRSVPTIYRLSCASYCALYQSSFARLGAPRRLSSTIVRAGKRITQNKFTEKAWQAIVAAPEISEEYQHPK